MVKAEININHIRKIIKKLPARQRDKFLKDLHNLTWQEQWKRLLARIDRRTRKHPPLTEEEIIALVDEVRAERHAQSRH